MADKQTSEKRAKTTKPRRSVKQKHDAGSSEERAQIARRAYEISQSGGAGSDEENWLRAEREVTGGRTNVP